MTYQQAVKYLDSFVNYEKTPQNIYKQSLRLESIKEFLNRLDNPQDNLRCIHIAGTKGKGSTCAFIAYILREAGYKVGLYTSPHLSDFRERIRILAPDFISNRKSNIGLVLNHDYSNDDFEGMISCEEIVNLMEAYKPEIERYNSQSRYGPLSFFEVYTTLAFIYFKKENVDFVVLETGLGGRLDATNTVNALIAAITPISYEHTKQLGSTLIEITQEKTGIIKGRKAKNTQGHQLIVITAPQEEEVRGVIRERCRQEEAVLYEVGRDIIFEKKDSQQICQFFNISGVFGRLDELKIRLLGRHQLVNATLAASVVLALRRFYQVELDLNALERGLYNTYWPGRFEIISNDPLIILDGAQNRASAYVLKEAVIDKFPDKRVVLILGVSKDKDIRGICQILLPISNEVILTQANNPRAADVDDIEQIAERTTLKTRRVSEALEIARKAAKTCDLILITGSLFLVGEARELLTRTPFRISQ